MFALTERAGPTWLEVADGIRIELRPVGTETLNAGRRAVRLAVMDNPNADVEFAFLIGCVQWAATAWEGIGDEEGAALDLTPERVERLIQQRPDIYDALDHGYVRLALELLAEKKGSSPLPNGISAEGQGSAKPAPKGRKTRKTATPAPTGKTPAAPPPATTSGAPSEPVRDS